MYVNAYHCSDEQGEASEVAMSETPPDYHTLTPWFPVIRHARSIGKSAGLSVVQLTVLVDESANPVLFSAPTATRLYPKDTAREAINEVVSKLLQASP